MFGPQKWATLLHLVGRSSDLGYIYYIYNSKILDERALPEETSFF